MGQLLAILGMVLCLAAILVLLFVVFGPRTGSLSADRRRPFGDTDKSAITSITDSTLAILDKTVGGGPYSRSRLEDAGFKMAPSNYLFAVLSITVLSAILGLFLGGPLLAFLPAIAVPILAWIFPIVMAERRRAKFDEQLGDNLMLITGGLRAGHSVLAAVDGAAKEAASPSAEEFARVVNEVRIGRDLNVALTETALRMRSDDFSWISQAIQINREVGGDLAEVLDHVGETIQERSEIKAQVRALSAEGRLSALILMCLPLGIGLMLTVINPGYIGTLTSSVLGWVLIAVGTVLMLIGGLWMRKIIRIEF